MEAGPENRYDVDARLNDKFRTILGEAGWATSFWVQDLPVEIGGGEGNLFIQDNNAFNVPGARYRVVLSNREGQYASFDFSEDGICSGMRHQGGKMQGASLRLLEDIVDKFLSETASA